VVFLVLIPQHKTQSYKQHSHILQANLLPNVHPFLEKEKWGSEAYGDAGAVGYMGHLRYGCDEYVA
jgi:hypothetical protein